MERDHFVSAAGLVRRQDGRVLLIRSPIRGWEFPGGMVEPGESIPAALLREIREESGITARIAGFSGFCKNVGLDIVNFDFLCEYAGGELALSEESIDAGWFSAEEAEAMIRDPLTMARFRRMAAAGPEMVGFSFVKEPQFQILEEIRLPVGCAGERESKRGKRNGDQKPV